MSRLVTELCGNCDNECRFFAEEDKDTCQLKTLEYYCYYCGETLMLCGESVDSCDGCDWDNEKNSCRMQKRGDN